jgi:hypothetical protein
LYIEEKLEVVSPAAVLQVPPEFGSIQRDCLYTIDWYSDHTCWYVFEVLL